MQSLSGRVLIADDERHVREVLREFLTIQGYEVATAATGTDALDAVPTFQPDVILVDLVMPGLSGPEVLDAMRRVGVAVPVILITGHEVTRREGFFDVVSKPFNLRRLADAVAAAIGHGRRESA
jgi:two-component system OmpR family response regulator